MFFAFNPGRCFLKWKTINGKTNYRNKPTLNSIFAYVNVAQKNNSKKERQLSFSRRIQSGIWTNKEQNEEQTKKPQNFFL